MSEREAGDARARAQGGRNTMGVFCLESPCMNLHFVPHAGRGTRGRRGGENDGGQREKGVKGNRKGKRRERGKVIDHVLLVTSMRGILH